MIKIPDLSVVMSVYNGEEYLSESIESILNQSFDNFEFIIINDGSTDNTKNIIEEFVQKDNRIVLQSQKNIGLTKSLNKGIKTAKGKYIARHDADDVSFEKRFESQINFFKVNPEFVLCGTWFEEINENQGSKIRKYPFDDKTLRKTLKYTNYFCHPSVMFLKEAFNQAGEYDEDFETSQDFELWIRLAEIGKVANIPEVLLKRRIGFSNTISWQKRNQKIDVAMTVINKHFSSWYKVNIFKFIIYYLPKLIYGFIPVKLLKIVRNLRYRSQ